MKACMCVFSSPEPKALGELIGSGLIQPLVIVSICYTKVVTKLTHLLKVSFHQNYIYTQMLSEI